ncbi:MAG: SRPBCC domain-containing protein [Chloroflexota bacterium]
MTEPMILRVRLAAPIQAVRHALTDAASLRVWLAEQAEVDLPRTYAFWGRYTPEGEAPHQRLLHVDDHTLRFNWLLDGEDTTVHIELQQEGADSTILTLSQTHFDMQEALTETTVRGVLYTFWALSLSNLADHLEGRELTARCDFTSAEMWAQFLIDASPEKVYDSLIDSDKASRWFGFPIGIEPWVGGRFAMGGLESAPPGVFAARIVALEPGRTMSVDWGDNGIATWELENSNGQTRLTFVQSGFTTQRPPYAGWMGTLSGFAALRRFHEKNDWQPMWLEVAVGSLSS